MVMVRESEHKVTDSDLELIKRLCLSYKEIGKDLEIPAFTVNTQIARLIVKFGVESRTAVLVKALKLNLVTLDQLVYRSHNGGTNLP